MSKPKIEDIVREITEPITYSLGMELVDIEYKKEGNSWFLRIFIDKPLGITHDDCQAVSERLEELLDQKDPIPHSYILEVSSPGIERPLRKIEDYQKFRGHKVRAITFAPIGGQKEFIGELVGLEGHNVLIDIKGKQIALPLECIAKVRLEAVL